MRENAGFEILDNKQIDPHTEVVIGHRKTFEEWVCWFYNIDNDYYYWGRYTENYSQAKEVYRERSKQPWI